MENAGDGYAGEMPDADGSADGEENVGKLHSTGLLNRTVTQARAPGRDGADAGHRTGAASVGAGRGRRRRRCAGGLVNSG